MNACYLWTMTGVRSGCLVELADKAAVALFSTPDDTWSYALRLVDLGVR